MWLNEQTLKVERENAKAMIEGFDKGADHYHVSIFTAHKQAKSIQMNFKEVPKLLSTKRSPPRPEYPLSPIGRALWADRYEPKYKHVAVLDRIFHIHNTLGIWKELCSDGVFDIWDPVAPYNSLVGKADPQILVLRIFEIDRSFHDDLQYGQYCDKIPLMHVKPLTPIIPQNEKDPHAANYPGAVYFEDIITMIRDAVDGNLLYEETVRDTSKIV